MQTQLPLFYIPAFQNESRLDLGEENSRHIIQVLRMKKGELLQLTDGKGHFILAEIEEEHKKHCRVIIKKVESAAPFSTRITIAISLIKNASRFEWFLEKATEIGVSVIQPLICARTEREKFRQDRLQGICIAAMIQSQQAWLPELREPMEMSAYLQQSFNNHDLFIAHCAEGEKSGLAAQKNTGNDRLLLIGPEGDFTNQEIGLAMEKGFSPVSLGDTRLRTETAGVVGLMLLKI